VILLVAFGAFVAAGVPLLLGFSAVLRAIGLSALISHAVPATDITASVILLMGMAVGVDYALFYLRREREERAAGHESDVAVQRAAATSGQAVLISGATVMIAMAGMILAGSKVFTSIGLGAMIVVFVAMIGSVTVLPAVLAKLGDRADRGLLAVIAAALARLGRPLGWQSQLLVRLKERRTVLQRLKGERQESALWGLVLRPAMRVPALTAIVSAALLLVLALPVLGMHTRFSSFADLPKDIKIVQSYEAVRQAFPGAPAPAQIVIKAPDVTSPRVQAGIAELKRQALASGVMHEPIQTSVSPAQRGAGGARPPAGDGSNTTSTNALKVLRAQVIPPTIGAVSGTQVAVSGDAAATHDFNETMKAHAPLVFGFVLGLAFLLLLLSFRSIVIPLKAIVLNLLSVGAAYGVLVWIFQRHTNRAGRRTRDPPDRLDGHQRRRGDDRRVRHLRLLSTLDMKQLGVGLAVAVLIDATIIRGLLLPATMKLLGRWNWYLPGWLQWLPQLHVEPELHEPARIRRPPSRPLPVRRRPVGAPAATSSMRRSPEQRVT
jgi:RND superfamily putative drug exporter